jgi:tetratricopeptide (TPR) repeat protein
MNSPRQPTIVEAFQQALALHQAGHLPEAEKWYRAILQAAPSHPDANHNLGLLLEHGNQPGSGLSNLQAALAAMPDNPQFILSYASAMAPGDPQASQALLENAVSRGIESAEIWCNLGNALYANGRLSDAAAAQKRSLQLRPDYALAWFNLGLATQDGDDLEAAADSYRQAVRIDPNLAEAYNNLGMVLREMGNDAGALEQFDTALRIRPQYVQARRNLVEAYNALGVMEMERANPATAARHFRAALAATATHAVSRINLANALLALGELEEALHHGKIAVAQDPAVAAGHHNLGSILRRLNRVDEAQACYRKALAIEPEFVEALLGLASILRYQDHDEAERTCRKALAIRPGSAQGHVLLADLLSSQGHFEQAEQELNEAIRLAPRMAEAWSAIPGLRKMSDRDADWLRQAEELATSGLPPEQAAYLHFSLGKYHDDTKKYAQAFEQYRIANNLSKRYTPRYEPAIEEQHVARIERDYDREWVCRQRQGSPNSMRPIFIVGMPRSGTSLVEQILAAHPAVFGAGELAYWKSASVRFSPFTANGCELRPPDDTELAELGKQFLEQLAQRDSSAARAVDKMPANFQCLGLIHAALPHARIIHMQRNPVDTCLSIYFQHFESHHTYANDLENIAHWFRCYRRLMSHWKQALPKDALFHLSYETLVQDQEQSTRRLLEFIGLPWDAKCLDFQQNERTIGTASNWQARQKINLNSVERWRRYAPYLDQLMPLLDEKTQ